MTFRMCFEGLNMSLDFVMGCCQAYFNKAVQKGQELHNEVFDLTKKRAFKCIWTKLSYVQICFIVRKG